MYKAVYDSGGEVGKCGWRTANRLLRTRMVFYRDCKWLKSAGKIPGRQRKRSHVWRPTFVAEKWPWVHELAVRISANGTYQRASAGSVDALRAR